MDEFTPWLAATLSPSRREEFGDKVTACTVDPGAAEYDPSGVGAVCAALVYS